jgi:hypothetical protein
MIQIVSAKILKETLYQKPGDYKNINLIRFPSEHLWYYQTGVKFPNLPSASFTSPDFLRFAMIQNMVCVNFIVSGSKFHYMGWNKIK